MLSVCLSVCTMCPGMLPLYNPWLFEKCLFIYGAAIYHCRSMNSIDFGFLFILYNPVSFEIFSTTIPIEGSQLAFWTKLVQGSRSLYGIYSL